MATLSITAPRTEARVEWGTEASLALHVPGWVGDGGDHLFVVPERSGGTYPWVQVDEPPAGGPGIAVVRFDASLAPHPRAGHYPVRVTAWRGSQQASVVVRFVVPRHPCLQVTPRPSVTFDPLTGTATVKLALWSCGNIDLDVSWSAHIRGRKVTVDPAQITVVADGRHVDTTLTIEVPDGTVDVEHELHLSARSEAGVETVLPPRAPPLPSPRVPPRPVRRRLVGGVIVAAAVAAGAVLTVSRLSATGGPPRSGPGDTEAAPPTDPPATDAGTAAPGPETTAGPSPTEPVGSTEGTVPSTTSPPQIEAEQSEQAVEALVGGEATASFLISNIGGSDAKLSVSGSFDNGPFSLGVVTCGGRLGPEETCGIEVAFRPVEAGTYASHLAVEDAEGGAPLDLVITGQAGNVDLVPIIGTDPLPSTCPVSATDCFAFTVLNQGDFAAPATEATVEPAGTEPLLFTVEVPPLAAGEQQDIAVTMNCPSRCEARVTVDSAGVVPESDEQNNVYAPPFVK